MGKDEVERTLRELLSKLGIAVDGIDAADIAGQTLFTIRTKDSGVLIGTQGETLRALNYVLRKFFEDAGDEAFRFVIDVNGYHLKHIKELENEARLLAERARTFKYDVEMSPMSPYDRLIVHSALGDIPEIATESAGEGRLRHIVIKYVGNTATPEKAA
ncbi:MAG: hypothetical protein JO026_04075 [Patescibacteria group bacterium]|nr:hypothetical protein [Patescibacteria group bacterium]